MKKDNENTNPGVRVNDSVYFRHEQHGVTHGVVAAVGQHGFTADSDEGDECNVLWSDFVGFRKRGQRSVKVLDEGEDGLLVENEDGSRSYFHGSLSELQSDSGVMVKSLPGGASIVTGDSFGSLSLCDQARVIADLNSAGFAVSDEYVRSVFGEQFSRAEQGRSFFGFGDRKNG